jgi:putative peptide zinc metalloprotease protein
MNAPPGQDQPSMAERLRAVRVGVRQDLEVSRHVFRGEPAYIVRDPVTFQSHRLDPADYQLFVSIDANCTLGETATELQQRGVLEAGEDEVFYQFVFQLHRLGFLSLPVSDEKLLFKRYQARQQARRRQKLMGFLFLQVPLVNPDAFLARTLPAARWLFSRWFFIVWLCLIGAAGYVCARRWDALLEPLEGLLATQNLLIMWVTLVLLKICHEFGHAYACKHFGGHVPEMGAYLIAFTPCAYVDATASWGFSRKRDRLIVSLAGVYIETTIAAVAVFVWALSGPSLLGAAAYNVMFLASIVTMLFNVNPLMRYDGYYVASDLLEIPNLRQRSTQHVKALARRVLLGIRSQLEPVGWRLGATLIAFGSAATLYKTLVLVGIGALIATKFFAVGLALAALFIGMTLWGMVRRLVTYLWFAEETAPVRGRAIALSVVLLVIIPGAIGVVPVPARVLARGAITAEQESVIRVSEPGFVRALAVAPGARVAENEPVASLTAPDLLERIAAAEAEVAAAEIRRRAYQTSDLAKAHEEAEQERVGRARLARARERLAELTLDSPQAGRVVSTLDPAECGRFLQPGEAVATVVAGQWQVRAVLTADQVTAAQPALGQRIVFRPAGCSGATLRGSITRIKPLGSRQVELAALTHLAGGDVVVHPETGEAQQPYFEIVVAIDDALPLDVCYGMTGVIALPATPEPLALSTYRRVVRFINSLRSG